MVQHFEYPIKLIKQKEGGFLIIFLDYPEAITQAETKAAALIEAADCLEEAVANRIAMKMPIPVPSSIKKGQYGVTLQATLAAKAALYLTLNNQKMSRVALAKKLQCDEKEIRRLLDPHYSSKLAKIEQALNLMGQRLVIGVEQHQRQNP